jgi:DNA invertase Pin-like site-specific DNA recombinase
VLVEDASRFARDLLAQELGILSLIQRGVRVLTASGDDLTQTDDPMKTAMRQMAGIFAELEKARLVGKLRGARERKRRMAGKCEGRKSHAELHPEIVQEAKRLRRRSPKTGKRQSYRDIAQELARRGHLNSRGREFSASSVRSMLGQ